jgi:hypothetical protein
MTPAIFYHRPSRLHMLAAGPYDHPMPLSTVFPNQGLRNCLLNTVKRLLHYKQRNTPWKCNPKVTLYSKEYIDRKEKNISMPREILKDKKSF